MRGLPVFQWLIFTILWATLTIPVGLLTRRGIEAMPVQREEARVVTCWVALRFSSTPSAFVLRQGDARLWSNSDPTGNAFAQELDLAIDTYGMEFVLSADLPDTPVAVTVTVEPFGRETREQTLWPQGDGDEVVRFSWGRDEN